MSKPRCLDVFLAGFLMAAGCGAQAQRAWISPTADELAMTAEPKAPGAPAILLSYEEIGEAESAEVWIHGRIKVLTPGGVSEGSIHLPEKIVSNDDLPEEVFARTVHRDGSIVEFHGTPQSTNVNEGKSTSGHVIAMPAVEVGSILEYICHFRNVNTLRTYLSGLYSPLWIVQRPLFQRSAKFTLLTTDGIDDGLVKWKASLPPGAEIKHPRNRVTLELKDVPAAPLEEMMPPPESVLYKVRFFYYRGTKERFWGTTGDDVDRAWSLFYEPHKGVMAAVKDLVQPTDTDEQKLHKLYAAVTAMENTDLTRQRDLSEDKKSGLRPAENSDDILLRKRGSSDELTLLFVAMAKAAGYPAYAMAVTSRDQATFDQDVLTWRQLDSLVAIVNVKGKDIFFDPGTRTCAFAHMAPWHANVVGISAEGKLMKVRYTPSETFGVSGRQRTADLTVEPDGTVSGTMRMAWIGNGGLAYRLKGFREDESAVRESLEKATIKDMPNGVDLKLEKLTGLADESVPLVATFMVSGHLGQSTGKRIVLPAELFESHETSPFSPEKRTQPILFPDEHQYIDIVKLHLPPGLKVESLPEQQVLHLDADTAYQAVISSAGDEQKGLTLTVQRTLALKRIDYDVADYPRLREYFGQVAASDQQQMVLLKAPITTP